MRFLLILLAGLLSANHVHSDTGAELRLMTYNIRYDTPTDGEDAWPNRREAVANLIRFHGPDILGMQEARVHQRDWLLSSLPDYLSIGAGRDDGKTGGELSPLFVNKERFDIHQSGTFWLSTTPDTPSLGWDAAFPRIASWARITDRLTGNQYLVVNTHWDHRGEQARTQSAHLLRRWLEENSNQGEHLVLMGDLNSTPSTEAYKVLLEGDLLVDAISKSEAPPFGPAGTFNGFDFFNDAGEPIDYILLSPQITVLRHGVITQHTGGRLPSDHYPIFVEIK